MRFGRVSEKSRRVLTLSTASIEAYEGSVRSGKTITSILDFAKFLRQDLDGEFAIVGKTERTAYRNVVEPLIAMFGKRHVRYNQGNGTVLLFGRRGYVIGANNELARTKVQGLTLLALYLDEAATLPESFFNMAYSRLSLEGAKMWLTANPEGRNHWLLVNWLAKARLWVKADGTVEENPDSPIDLHRYTFVIDDNAYLPAAFVRRLKASYTGVWYLRYILSQWTNAEGAIFDMWDPAIHVKKIPANVYIVHKLVGVDYGTTNATAAVLLALGSDGRLYVLSEWGHNSRDGEPRWTDGQLSAGLRAWMSRWDDIEWVMVDPSAASFRLQLFADGVRNVASASNSVLDGIREIASLLAMRNLLVDPSCTNLTDEMPGYAWDPKATERGDDEPLKVADHWIDAKRYAVRAARRLWLNDLREASAA